jgi:F-box protein 11
MKRRKPKPAAFMSYARSDDDRFRRLTQFREDLSAEVQRQIGEEFPIFQDREDILWGQNGKVQIKESLDEVIFLIPIITPSFFKSPCCCRELQRFLEREKELGRDDLVLSVYYIDCPLLNDKENRTGNELAQAIFYHHQYEDWRDMRFEPFTFPQVGKTLARLAVQIHDALERVQASEKREAPESNASVARRPADTISFPLPPDIISMIKDIARGPSAKTEPPIRVVDRMHRADHATITEAIEAADPGDRILVRPGRYPEGIVIDKPGLEIIGDGDPGEIVVHATGKNALLFQTTMGKVTNLTLLQTGGGRNWYGVDIAQGRLELEECNIISQSDACVVIHGGADPLLRRNHIHDGKKSGVFVYDNGQGVLEDNDIFGNALSGMFITEGGNPTLRHNRINNNGYWAVWAYNGGGGTIEDNDLRGNAKGAWNISADSEPNLRRARNKE